MLIANPIYDVTFKRILENNRVAKFLIGTILGCDVLSLVPGTPEFTDTKDDSDKLTLFQMDFTATISTKEEGEKLVIIEMQKARDLADVYRFKRYLGKQYTKSKLPIISIYILGFDLKSVDSPAFAALPDCRDLTTNEKLAIRHSFVSQLTHRAYFIQTKKIKPSLNTRLEKLLSIFEQANFVGDSIKIKDYHLAIDDPEIKELLGVLSYVAANKEAREELDREEETQLRLEGIFGKQNKKFAEAQEKLEQIEEKLGQTKEKLGQTKEKLGQTKEKLGQTKEKLGQTEEKLGQTEEKLGQTEEKLEQAEEVISQKDKELQKQAEEIDALKRKLEAMGK